MTARKHHLQAHPPLLQPQSQWPSVLVSPLCRRGPAHFHLRQPRTKERWQERASLYHQGPRAKGQRPQLAERGGLEAQHYPCHISFRVPLPRDKWHGWNQLAGSDGSGTEFSVPATQSHSPTAKTKLPVLWVLLDRMGLGARG